MFESQLPLRWGDLDAQGHVNNAVFLDYLQEARVEFLIRGGLRDLLDSGVIVVSHQVEYRRAVGYSADPVHVRLGIAELGGSRFMIAYELHHDGELCLRARTVACPFDFAAQRPRRLTGRERDYLAAHRVDAGPLPGLPDVALAGRGWRYPLRTRWSDQDAYRHVNNTHLFGYAQEARIALLAGTDPATVRQGQAEPSHVWLLARQDVEYRRQVDFRFEPYALHTGVTRIGRTSITTTAELCDSDAPDATVFGVVRSVLVCAGWDLAPIEPPEHLRAAFAGLLVA